MSSSSTSWEEIKKLAATFQQVQLTESALRLSERNCIEIITKLIETGQLNVIHTTDGKEYITDKHLEKEIYDELYVHDGRINVVKLQALLNVDISYIESKVGEIVKNDSNLNIILGQIISKDYMNKMCEDINEQLQERGSISLTELTNTYELPTEFVNQIIEPRVGSIIHGNYDRSMIYTHQYIDRQKAIISGALEACIRPIRFAHLIRDYELNPATIFEIYDQLIEAGQLEGSLYGGRQEATAVFVPLIYSKAQRQYVEAFFKQNNYIDYSSLKKIGITEPESYIKSIFTDDETIKYFSSSCFSSFYMDQIEPELEDYLNRTGYCDLSQILPPSLNQKDLDELTVYLTKTLKLAQDCVVMSDCYMIKKELLTKLSKSFHSRMEAKSVEDLRQPTIVMGIRSEQAVVSVSGVSEATTTTTSSKGKSKSKGGKKTTQESHSTANDQILIEISFIDRKSLIDDLKKSIEDLPDDLIDPLVEHFLKPLNNQYFDLLKTKIETGLITTSKQDEGSPIGGASSKNNAGDAGVSKKTTMKEIQEKIKIFLLNARIFEKALNSMDDSKVQDQISKHLNKTMANDIANDMTKFLAHEQLITFNENLTSEARSKLVQKFKEPHKQRLTELNQGLGVKSFSEVIELVEKTGIDSFEFTMKKNEAAKREKEMILQLRESTKASLEVEKEPATILQLTSLLLYYQATGHILNAPGRCVPSILESLKSNLSAECHSKLVDYQNLVIDFISGKLGEETIDVEKSNEIRSIGINAKSHVLAKK